MNRYLAIVAFTGIAVTASTDGVLAQGLRTSRAYGIHIGGFRPYQINTGGFASGGVRSTFVGVPGIHAGGIHTVVGQRFIPSFSSTYYGRPMLGAAGPVVSPNLVPALSPYGMASDLGLPVFLPAAPAQRSIAPISSGLDVGPVARVTPIGSLPRLTPARLAAVRALPAARNVFTPTWFDAHPAAWRHPDLAARVRRGVTFDEAVDHLEITGSPFSYDYGGRMKLRDGDVYYDGQPFASVDEYLANGVALAASGSAGEESAEGWRSLGGYALVNDEQADPATFLHLAVNKNGMIRGSAYDAEADNVLRLSGALNRKYQRAAWTLGDDSKQVFDAGLYDLTRDSTPVLRYSAKDGLRQQRLVRLE